MKATFFALALALITPVIDAATPIRIEEAWSRTTAPGQVVGGGFMTIVNESATGDRLVSATSPIGKSPKGSRFLRTAKWS
jgi:copper(I)-binding protein